MHSSSNSDVGNRAEPWDEYTERGGGIDSDPTPSRERAAKRHDGDRTACRFDADKHRRLSTWCDDTRDHSYTVSDWGNRRACNEPTARERIVDDAIVHRANTKLGRRFALRRRIGFAWILVVGCCGRICRGRNRVGHGTGASTPSSRPMSRPHPLQWWLWAASVSAVALLTTNLWLLLGLVVVEATVWASCPSVAEGDALMVGFVRIAVVVIFLRLALQVLFGKPVGSEVAFSLPSVDLPAWMDGITVGGTVTWAGILGATERSLQLVVVLIAFALANSRSSAHALIRVLPVSLYEIGVISAVSLRVAPAAVITSRQVKLGMRLRGHRSIGVRATGHIVSTTLSLALEQSVHLAESMEMRGLGRNDAPRSTSRIISACTLLAVTAVSVTVFGWIGGWSGAYVAGAAVVTAVCAALAARLSAQVTPRTRLTEHERSASSALAVMGIAAATIALGWWLTTHLEVAQPSIAPIQLPLPPAWVWLGLAVFFTQALCDTRPASPIPDLAR